MTYRYDVHIAVRIYPGISKSPFISRDNKLNLTKIGLYSLKEALLEVNPRITIILDGCPDSYEEAVRNIFPDENVTSIVKLEKAGNAKSFKRQIDILLMQEDSSIIMFAEDDYIYSGSDLKPLIDLIKAKKADFVTPYDHLDYYNLLIHKKNLKYEKFHEQNFKLVNSTCLTFLTSKEVLKECKKTFETYLKDNSDASIFWALTKEHVLSPISFIRFLIETVHGNSLFLKLFVKAWIFSSFQILFGKSYKIAVPLPSLATHMEEGTLAPEIDWNNRAAELIQKYNI